jgi:voltage-gated potassium channel Kch
VFACALIAFGVGVGTTERAAIPDANFLTHLYYGVGLFVLGGMDLGMPTGGPLFGRVLLWVAYFLGPLVTTTAVAEGFLRAVQPEYLRRRTLREHVVLVGLDRVGQRYLEAVRATHPNRTVLVVDTDANHRAVLLGRRDPNVMFQHGDASDPGIRAQLRLEYAKGVVLTAPDDLVNLEIAWDLANDFPLLPVAALVADSGIRRGSGQMQDGGGPQLFNVHRMVASHLYESALHAHFHDTAEQDTVVIAGFGRFGQTILEYLQLQAACELQRVIIVDLHADSHAERFEERAGFHRHGTRNVVSGDMTRPSTWDIVDAIAQNDAHPAVVILASEHDDLNRQTAMLLRRRNAPGRIFVRVFHDGAYVRALAKHYDIDILAVDKTLDVALRERHLAWFGNA